MTDLDLNSAQAQRVIAALLETEPGWATRTELTAGAETSHQINRGRTRRLLIQLAHAGIAETFVVRHRGEPLDCYLINTDALRALVVGS